MKNMATTVTEPGFRIPDSQEVQYHRRYEFQAVTEEISFAYAV
jgi:hypothetical protein